MAKRYYRLVEEYLGEEYTFEPKKAFEAHNNGVITKYDLNETKTDILFYKNDVKEVCFSKSLAGCVFGICGMSHYKRGKKYYIYTAQEEPDVDLSQNTVGDFAITGEVRYQRPVFAEYDGCIEIGINVESDVMAITNDMGNYVNPDIERALVEMEFLEDTVRLSARRCYMKEAMQ